MHCWVIGVCKADCDQEYAAELGRTLAWLGKISIIGFAFKGDACKLKDLATALSVQFHPRVIDLQLAAVSCGVGALGRPSSLRTVVERWMQGYTLDKAQQCSNWEQRPLLPKQLRYAALDALVLLLLW